MTQQIQFTKATKADAKLKAAITGPPGSGKTYTALVLASHLAPTGKVALIDTERGSASLYAGEICAFDKVILTEFHPNLYIQAIRAAVAGGYEVLVIDSLTHAWTGKKGILALHDEATLRSASGNSYLSWGEVTPIHNKLIDEILQAPIHIIATMRSKMEYVLEENSRGKQVPRKVGMGPVQRQDTEYEFSIVMDMDSDNNGVVTKTRCSALTNAVIPKPGKELADTLKEWLSGEVLTEPEQKYSTSNVDTDDEPTEHDVEGAKEAFKDRSLYLLEKGTVTRDQLNKIFVQEGNDPAKALDRLNTEVANAAATSE